MYFRYPPPREWNKKWNRREMETKTEKKEYRIRTDFAFHKSSNSGLEKSQHLCVFSTLATQCNFSNCVFSSCLLQLRLFPLRLFQQREKSQKPLEKSQLEKLQGWESCSTNPCDPVVTFPVASFQKLEKSKKNLKRAGCVN